MPAVLKQLSLIVATLAGVITLLAGRAAGVRADQLGLRTAAAFAIFFAIMYLLARAVVAVTPTAWSDVRLPPTAPPQLGQQLDVTVPGASPADVGFIPSDLTEFASAVSGEKGAAEAAQRIAADPATMARVLAAMSQGDQEG